MAPHILGISASPVENNRMERELARILDHTAMDSELIRLADCDTAGWEDCLACAGPDSCRFRNDGRDVAMKLRRARAFALAACTSHQGLDAGTRSLLARVSCERGRNDLLRAKVGAAIVSSPCLPGSEHVPRAATVAVEQVASWMRREGIRNVGVLLLLGDASCIRCAQRGGCDSNRVVAFHDKPDAAPIPVVSSPEEHAALLSHAYDLGQAIRGAALENADQPPDREASSPTQQRCSQPSHSLRPEPGAPPASA